MPLTNYKNRNEKYSARANSNSENLLITKVVKELKFQAHYVEKKNISQFPTQRLAASTDIALIMEDVFAH